MRKGAAPTPRDQICGSDPEGAAILALDASLSAEFIFSAGGSFCTRLASFFLSAPFGLLALLFQSLHFLLAFQQRSGHRVSFKSECKLTISQLLRWGLPAWFTRLARGFTVIFV